ncbi:MAPK-interacting and spindle-stabilizing protein-like [Ammospiza nelsoni]|uniref:MAPK-interacting and spindle-stabilizing protein-like n=1 Tax=Ammospiza nelsoni TaxID=2857394 RepID=UPI00286C10C4|nr:MAPK-interacting and spindle-stabilizing protein-like [Ammospiza nelsoni]
MNTGRAFPGPAAATRAVPAVTGAVPAVTSPWWRCRAAPFPHPGAHPGSSGIIPPFTASRSHSWPQISTTIPDFAPNEAEIPPPSPRGLSCGFPELPWPGGMNRAGFGGAEGPWARSKPRYPSLPLPAPGPARARLLPRLLPQTGGHRWEPRDANRKHRGGSGPFFSRPPRAPGPGQESKIQPRIQWELIQPEHLPFPPAGNSSLPFAPERLESEGPGAAATGAGSPY